MTYIGGAFDLFSFFLPVKSCINIQIPQPSYAFSLNVYFTSFLLLVRNLVLRILHPEWLF